MTADGLAFGAPKNKASRRSVPLNKMAVAALESHLKRQNEERLRAPVWHDHDLVFPNRVGKPMDHNNLYHREYKALLRKAGLHDQASPSTVCATRSAQRYSRAASIRRWCSRSSAMRA